VVYKCNSEWKSIPKKKEIAPEMFKNLFYELKNNFLGQDIYTNVSENKQKVGLAFINDKEIITHKLQKKCFIYTAEAMAIIEKFRNLEIFYKIIHTKTSKICS